MAERLQIWACTTYRREIQEIIRARDWVEVELHSVSRICLHPYQGAKLLAQFNRAASETKNNVLLLGSCFAGIKQDLGQPAADCAHCLDQCFYMITNRSLVDHLMNQGAYLLTPGWLEQWHATLTGWGFNQTTAREFFHECTQKLLLLDTGLNPLSVDHLREFGAYLDMPVETVPVGMDHFDLYLNQIVSDWKREEASRQTEVIRAEYNRQVADNAMALDLLTHLTRTLSEEDATLEILDLFTMLFSPGSVAYCSVAQNRLDNPFGCNLDERECMELQTWALERQDDYAWTSSGEGFYLRLSHQNQTVGVLRLENLQLPQYKQQYLNLSLSIARLCGLVISNTRMYRQLQQAEQTARREKDISEALRQVMTELTSQLDLEDVLAQILESLIRVIPYTNAVIFMLDDARQLQYKAGLQCNPTGDLISFSPARQVVTFDISRLQKVPHIIPDLEMHPKMQEYFGGDSIHGWLGVPLLQHNTIIGYLSIGNQKENAYGEVEAALARSFADQASIAIENARLFKEIQTLAVTDSLTGLYNRRHFFDMADHEIKRSLRYSTPLSVIMIDVDYFKKVNDTFGHTVGDQVLREVANCYRRNIRVADIAGRYGGEEFVLMLPDTPLSNAELLAERLRKEVAELRVPSEEGVVQLSISLGVAELGVEESLDELLRQSDSALYDAKRAGRNCVRTFKKEMDG